MAKILKLHIESISSVLWSSDKGETMHKSNYCSSQTSNQALIMHEWDQNEPSGKQGY